MYTIKLGEYSIYSFHHNFSVSKCKNIVSTAKTAIISKPAPAGVSGVELKGQFHPSVINAEWLSHAEVFTQLLR